MGHSPSRSLPNKRKKDGQSQICHQTLREPAEGAASFPAGDSEKPQKGGWRQGLRMSVNTFVKAKKRGRPRTELGHEGNEEPQFLLC